MPVLQQFSGMSSPHARDSKAVLDSGFQGVDSGFQLLNSRLCQGNLDSGLQSLVCFRIPGTESQSLSGELGFWIPIVSWIPDSLRCVSDFKAQGPGFQLQKFPDSLIWGDVSGYSSLRWGIFRSKAVDILDLRMAL